MRARQKAAATAAAPLMYERADWQLFLRPETLPQKAGCTPQQIGRITLKEVVDNALDNGEEVKVEKIPGGYRVIDHGPGIAPPDVPKLFAVNRPLLSSKLKRLPLRGMLGNGLRVVMGAVAAYDGAITVTTRGHRLELAVDPVTGLTSIVSDKPAATAPGTTVEITLREFNGSEKRPAELSLIVARQGRQYSGPSQPAWYGPDDLRELLARVTPDTATVGAVVADVFDIKIADRRIAATLPRDEIGELYHQLRGASDSRRLDSIGYVGNDANEHYGRAEGVARIGAAEVPYCVEAWATCEHAGKNDETKDHRVELLLNRSPTIAPLWVSADSRKGLAWKAAGSTR
jgi:hypothetical protein